MLMMRSSASVTKMSKPPPPVPPRPSKILVAEAMAKTNEAIKITSAPTRTAPLPPNGDAPEVVKPNIFRLKPVNFSRPLSNDFSRPVVFQSNNMLKKDTNYSTNNNYNRTAGIKRVSSFKTSPKEVISENGKTTNTTIEETKTEIQINGVNHTVVSGNVINVSKTLNGSIDKHVPVVENVQNKIEERDQIEKVRNYENVIIDNRNEGATIKIEANNATESVTNSPPISETNDLVKENYFNSINITLSSPQSDVIIKTNDETLEHTKVIQIDHNMENKSNSESSTNDDDLLNDRNHVNTLIDEMFASVLDVSSSDEDCENTNSEKSPINESPPSSCPSLTTILIIENDKSSEAVSLASNTSSFERKKIDDKKNHEFLILELQNMKKEQEKVLKRQRMPSLEVYPTKSRKNSETNDDKILTDDACLNSEIMIDNERVNMASLHGLPPLPKSLSGFNLLENHSKTNPPTPVRTSSMRSQRPSSLKLEAGSNSSGSPISGSEQNTGTRKTTGLDRQLAILRREMYSLRQLDLSLLSQLWSLNESIQDFRHILQDQDDRVLSPPSPSPTPSSEDEEGDFYSSAASMSYRQSPHPPPRRPSSSSNASTGA